MNKQVRVVYKQHIRFLSSFVHAGTGIETIIRIVEIVVNQELTNTIAMTLIYVIQYKKCSADKRYYLRVNNGNCLRYRDHGEAYKRCL